MTALRSAVVVIVAMLCLACDKSPTSPTSTSTTSTSSTTTTTSATTQVFELTVPPGGARFYSLTESQAGQVSVTLASIQLSTKATPVSVALRIGIGLPAGEGCAVTEAIDAMPSLTSQLTSAVGSGIFCINVADAGTLTVPVLVLVRVTHS